MKTLKTQHSAKRGAALVEYGLIVAGVALVCLVAVSIFGGKTSALFGVAAAALPGATADDNGIITTGKIASVEKDGDTFVLNPGEENNLERNLGITAAELVVDPSDG
jgi:Flp pilus assembly pilin Flp